MATTIEFLLLVERSSSTSYMANFMLSDDYCYYYSPVSLTHSITPSCFYWMVTFCGLSFFNLIRCHNSPLTCYFNCFDLTTKKLKIACKVVEMSLSSSHIRHVPKKDRGVPRKVREACYNGRHKCQRLQYVYFLPSNISTTTFFNASKMLHKHFEKGKLLYSKKMATTGLN